MLLLSIIPNSWASAREHAIQERALPELTFNVAREIVINHYKARKPAPLATCISSVKKKDKDPKFQQQTSSSSLSSNNNSNNSSNDDRKKRNQRCGRKNKGNNEDNKGGSNQGHSHIASFAHLGISSPIIPESPSVTHPVDHNRGPLHMQRFSSATTCGTVYENAQSARSLANHLGLPKYVHVLEPMEQGYAAASSSKRGLDGPSSSAPPNKHSKSIEVEEVHDLHNLFYDDSDSEYQERIALNAINASLHTEIVSEANVNMDIADSAGFDDDVKYDLVSISSNDSDNDRQVPYLSLSSHTDTTLQCPTVLAASKCRRNNIMSCITFAQFISDHFATCVNYKGKKSVGNSQPWIVNSGASSHFTHDLEDFAEYEPMNDGLWINTSSKDNPVQIKGKGTVFMLRQRSCLRSGSHKADWLTWSKAYRGTTRGMKVLEIAEKQQDLYTVQAWL
ncbi:hypothetical protein PQX77_019747 [Marasmius sp. AFHP31]|nr:hypothetical protein PQX77_019747 [Marasmius sp. AFHP31]